MKRLLIGFLLLTALLSSNMAVFAAKPSQRPPEPTIGVKSLDPSRGRIDVVKPKSMGIESLSPDLIQIYGCEVFSPQVSTASISGYTDLYSICDEVSVAVYLQRWDGSGWLDIANKSITEYYSDYTAVGKDTPGVPSGYYRARAVHYARNASGSEVTYSESPFIWAD